MATKTQKSQFNISKKKRELAKKIEFNIQPWDGIITSQDPYTISENSAVWCSGLPKLTGAIENVKDAETLYSYPTDIKDFFVFGINNERYYCIVTSSYLRIYNKSFIQIVSYSTSFQQKLEYAIQDNSYLWIVSRNFLLTFDGTNLYDLTSHGITGDAICYWKGRIFIGKDRVITFSVPSPDPTGATNPFNTQQGAGALTLTISLFSKIYSLIPKEDSIYIFTNKSIVSLIGTTISNDPTQWYLTEITKELGITGIRNYIVREHTIYFHSILGIHAITATVPDKIDDAITDITTSIDSLSVSISLIDYKGVPYIAVVATNAQNPSQKALYLYNILFKKWYSLSYDKENSSKDVLLLSHYSDGNTTTTYAVTRNNDVKQLMSSDSYIPLYIKSKVYFNTDDVYLNIKKITVYGRGFGTDISVNIISPRFSKVGSDTKSFKLVQPINSFIFTNQTGNIIFVNAQGDKIIFSQESSFWYLIYKPAGTYPLQMRTSEFQIEIKQSNAFYTEIINIKIEGTVGAKYA
jgi:hypothetical protein